MGGGVIKKITPPTTGNGDHRLKVYLDTITICEPGVLITLEAFNKYMLTF